MSIQSFGCGQALLNRRRKARDASTKQRRTPENPPFVLSHSSSVVLLILAAISRGFRTGSQVSSPAKPHGTAPGVRRQSARSTSEEDSIEPAPVTPRLLQGARFTRRHGSTKVLPSCAERRRFWNFRTTCDDVRPRSRTCTARHGGQRLSSRAPRRRGSIRGQHNPECVMTLNSCEFERVAPACRRPRPAAPAWSLRPAGVHALPLRPVGIHALPADRPIRPAGETGWVGWWACNSFAHGS